MARSDGRSSGGSSPKTPASPNTSSAPDLSILGDQVSLHPTGFTGTTPDLSTTSLLPGGPQQPYTPQSLQAQQQHESPDHNLVEGVARFRQAPFEFLRELSSHVSGHGWRSYDNVVGQPVFYAGFSEQMKARVTGNPMLKAKIRELAAQRVEVEDREEGRFGGARESGGGEKARRRGAKEKERRRREVQTQLEEVVEGMTDDMICKMESKRFIRGAYYLCAQILTRAYHQGGFVPTCARCLGWGGWLAWCWFPNPCSLAVVWTIAFTAPRVEFVLTISQAFTSILKKSSGYALLRRRRRGISTVLFFCLVTARMSTTFHYNSSAIGWAWRFPQSSRVTI